MDIGHKKCANAQPERIEHKLGVCFKSFPPDTTPLMALGFDEAQISKSHIIVRKTHARDRLGRPALFFEMKITKNDASVSYGVPPGHNAAILGTRAASQFLRLLSILDGAAIDAKGASELFLPPLATAEALLTLDIEVLLKRNSDMSNDLAVLSKKNRRLSLSSEETCLLLMEKERQILSLQSRVDRLQAVPDAALADLLIDWLRNHHGEFDSSAFSRTNHVSSGRAEEGLASLVRAGVVSQIGGSLHVATAAQKRIFVEKDKGWLGRFHYPFLASKKVRPESQ